jgi:hypothetical protein
MDGNLMSDVILSAYSATALRVSAVQALWPQESPFVDSRTTPL